MENLRIYNKIIRQTLTICLIISLSLISCLSNSQNPADFSGKWTLDNSKSSANFVNTASTINITQKNNKIDLEITLIPKGTKPITRTENYLIGVSVSTAGPKESRSDHKNTTIKMEWSSNKQAFIITEENSYPENGTTKESKRVKVYSLTDGGKTMTIKSDDTLPEGSITPESERHTTMVYNKSK